MVSFTDDINFSSLPPALSSPDDIPRFDAFEETVEVLKSKEKPKKIGVRAHNGHVYFFLCKREERGGGCFLNVMFFLFHFAFSVGFASFCVG